MNAEAIDITEHDEDVDADERIVVLPFIEVESTTGARTWIRKSSIDGVEEVTSSDWNSFGQRSSRPSMLVHAKSGKSWRIVGDAEAFVLELGQAEL